MKTIIIRLLITLIAAFFACDNADAATKKRASKTKVKSSQAKATGLVSYLESRGMDSSKSARVGLANKNGVKGYDFSPRKNNELLALLKSRKPKTSVTEVAKKPIQAPQKAPKAEPVMESSAAICLQQYLQILGYKVTVTGHLDKSTRLAYESWQSSGFFRGKKGEITLANLQKIQKLAQAKTPMVEKLPSQKNTRGVKKMFARTTHFNRHENTYKYKTVTRIVKGVKKKVRIKYDSDPWSKQGMTFTDVPQFQASEHTVGTAAVDEAKISYGSAILVPTAKRLEFYIAGDTGTAVVARTAAINAASTAEERNAIVVDCVRYSDPAKFAHVLIIPYDGKVPFRKLSMKEKLAHFDLNRVKSMFAPYLKGLEQPRAKQKLLVAN